MKTFFQNLFRLALLVAFLGLMTTNRVTAQNFTTLHTFTGDDGTNSMGGLVRSGSTLYGTAVWGGSFNAGVIFAINVDGTGFTTLHSFNQTNGFQPAAKLILSGDTLYGTTWRGGSFDSGTVFAIKTNGTSFTNLFHFDGSNGALPEAELAQFGNTLYGTTTRGGGNGDGNVFAINTDGTGFTNLHSFYQYVFRDGSRPVGGLVSAGDGIFYGTTSQGGPSGDGYYYEGAGTVFGIDRNGNFWSVYNFTSAQLPPYKNSDGAYPWCRLILRGSTLFGTTSEGGDYGMGTVFALNVGGAFAKLHSFNGDGAFTDTGLILAGDTLFGASPYTGVGPMGPNGRGTGTGTVYSLKTNGANFTILHTFATNEGTHPEAKLVLFDNTVFGTTWDGGSSNCGTIFSLSVPPLEHPDPAVPPLNIASFGDQSVLFWPVSEINYDLQRTASLSSPDWVTVPDAVPVIALAVTNTSPTRYFRLIPQP